MAEVEVWLKLSSILVYISCFVLSSVEGSKCKSIAGSWYNELGEEVILMRLDGGFLYGEYHSDLERAIGVTGGMSHSVLHGYMPYAKAGDVFGFSVSFRNGAVTKTWTGQCHVCDGEEQLVMSWLMRYSANTCRDKWKSTMIGQDIFTRRKPTEEETVALETENNIPYTINFVSVEDRNKNRPQESKEVITKCSDISGAWYNDVGSEIILTQESSGEIKGEYRTGVERTRGSAGTTHSQVFGFRRVQGANATLTLLVVWKNGSSITGFVGQCHVCHKGGEPSIETTWILRTGVASCDDNWKSTIFGKNTFTRQEQKAGPRKGTGRDAPSQAGEADQLSVCGGTRQRSYNSLALHLILISFLLLHCLL